MKGQAERAISRRRRACPWARGRLGFTERLRFGKPCGMCIQTSKGRHYCFLHFTERETEVQKELIDWQNHTVNF